MLSSTQRSGLFPPRLKSQYTDFDLISEGTYFKIFEATHKVSRNRHSIRVLDTDSEFVKTDHNFASTLFVQEILWLASRVGHPEYFYIENFEIYDDKIGFVMKNCYPLIREKVVKPSVDIENIIRDTLSDVTFVRTQMMLQNLNIDPKNVYRIKDTQSYFFGNWAECFLEPEINEQSKMDLTTSTFHTSKNFQKSPKSPKYTSPEGRKWATDFELEKESPDKKKPSVASEVYSLGLLALDLLGLEQDEWDDLPGTKNSKNYKVLLEDLMKRLDSFKLPRQVHSLIRGMLQKDPELRVTQEEFFPKPQREKSTVATPKKSMPLLRDIIRRPAAKIAWSSWSSNVVSLYDAKEDDIYSTFKGAQISKKNGVTLLKHIPGSNYLASSILNWSETESVCNFQVLDLAKENQVLFSLGESNGVISDLAYNPKRNILAVQSLMDQIAYHIFDCKELKITKKAKWQYPHKCDITGLDFDPDGKRIASIDENGVLVLSEPQTNTYLSHVDLQGESYGYHKCRWNPVSSSVAVTFDFNRFNIVDAERQTLLHKFSPVLDNKYAIMSIDWKKDGNILACSGGDQNIKLYDKREGQVIRILEDIHRDWIRTVQWSPCGTLLATASTDKTAKLIDVSAGKPIYSGSTADNNRAWSVTFI